MQLRFRTKLSSEEYVKQKAWQHACLEHCPLHPNGGCSIARHGTYDRVKPHGTRVARWYCPESHCTFSLLPDCLASRLSGSLSEIEAVILQVEQANSINTAAEQLRPDIELPGVLRWIRRRVRGIQAAFAIIKELYSERFADCQLTITAFSQHINGNDVLFALREIAASHLVVLAPPLGFKPPPLIDGGRKLPRQQHAGPDPPIPF